MRSKMAVEKSDGLVSRFTATSASASAMTSEFVRTSGRSSNCRRVEMVGRRARRMAGTRGSQWASRGRVVVKDGEL